MVGVAGDFAAMAGQGGGEFGEVGGRALDEEIGLGEWVPVFGLNAPGRCGGIPEFSERGGDEEVDADVRGMVVVGVGIKDPARTPAAEDVGDGLHAAGPDGGVGGVGVDAGPVEDFEFPAEAGAGVGEFAAPGFAAAGVAAEGDGEVDDACTSFALEPQREGAGDDFVVGMGRKEEGDGGVGRGRGEGGRRRGRGRGKGAAQGFLVVADEFPVGVHADKRTQKAAEVNCRAKNRRNEVLPQKTQRAQKRGKEFGHEKAQKGAKKGEGNKRRRGRVGKIAWLGWNFTPLAHEL